MPTYDYECDACGHRFEEFQYFSEEPLKTCPACAKDTLRRLFGTGAAILFKGSGFHETDYRSDSYKAAAKKDSEPGKSATDGAAGTNGTGGTAAGGSGESAKKNATNTPKSTG